MNQMIPQMEMSIRTSGITHVCMTIEGQHNGESFESSHTIPLDMLSDYMSEFFEAYAENPKTAKFNMYYCDCSGCRK